MSDYVARIKEVAYRAHAGQVDLAGRPYIEHVTRVAAACSDDPKAEAVAWGHDVLEDAPHLRDALMAAEPPADVWLAITLLSRKPGQSPADYHAGIRTQALARRVKLEDIGDNEDEKRLALLDPKTAGRLRRKYAKARAALQGADL